MPGGQTQQQFELEGVTIDLSQISVRAAVIAALNFIPGVGGILSAIAAVMPVRGRTQHIGVSEGYEYARKFVSEFHPYIVQALTDEKLRLAFTRWITKRLYMRYRQRWPNGLALSELERMRLIGTTAQSDESYTIYYLAAYFFFRNADAEHLREEFERDFAGWINEDLQAFGEELKNRTAIEGVELGTSGAGIAALVAAVPVLFLAKKFLR